MAATQQRPEPVTAQVADGDGLPPEKPGSRDRLNILIYGQSGAGKTFLAGTAEDDPRTRPVLFIDQENGAMTIDWRGSAMRIVRPSEINNDLLGVADLCKRGKAIFHPTGEPFRTVVIDSLTDASRTIESEIIRRPGRKRDADQFSLEFGEWTGYMNQVREIARAFRDADVNLIITCYEQSDDDGVRPAIVGKKMAESLPHFFNTVARLSVKAVPTAEGRTKPQRVLLLSAETRFVAKDRSDRLGTMDPTMVDPTVTKLMDRIESGRRLAQERAAKTAGK